MTAPAFIPMEDEMPPAGGNSVRISGTLDSKALKQATRKLRSGSVGPTSVYYAGVTAPAISAGMATIVRASLERAGWMPYWIFMVSSIVAAMSGISWYLIFMRISYRHSYGRSTETGEETWFEADAEGIFWSRGAIRSRILWAGVEDIRALKKFIHVKIRDGEDLILLRTWFESAKHMDAFVQRLQALKAEADTVKA